MKKVIFVVLVFIIAETVMGRGIFAQSSQYQQHTDKPIQQETIHLFNGKNLDGWYKFLRYRGRNNDPNGVFKVEDGMIHISGTEKGCITTKKEYGDYRLVIEYKYDKDNPNSPSIIEGVARDGGVLLNSQGRDGAYSGIWMSSIEVNIIEGGTGDFIVVGDGTDRFQITAHVAAQKQGSSYLFEPGSDYLATIRRGRVNWLGRDPTWENVRGFKGENDLENPLGEWNKLECIVYGDKISVYLNGHFINEAINVRPTKGKIQIQSEVAAMLIRRVDLTPLTTPSSVDLIHSGYTRLFNGKDLEGWRIYGTERWYVDNNGILICESGPDNKFGYLGTVNDYKNFDLTLEFLQEANGNSGVFFHSSVEGTKISGWQAEVAPPGKYTGGIYESYGRGWLIKPDPSKESVLRMGKWNTMRVRVNGDTVDTWLNGTPMIHLVDEKIGNRTGQIALQIHAGGGIKVKWKNIWVKEL